MTFRGNQYSDVSIFTQEMDTFILAHYRVDMTTRQIAKALGTDPQRIRRRWHNIKRAEQRGRKPDYTRAVPVPLSRRAEPSMPRLRFLGEQP